MGNSGLADFSGLKRRLAVLYALTAAAIIAGGFWSHGHFRALRLAAAEKLLLSTAEIKLDQLRFWREDRLSDAGALLDSPVLGQYLARFAADPADRAAAALLEKRLQAYIRHKKYPFAGLADGGGRVLVSAGLKPEAGCRQIEALVRRARASGRPEIGEFYRAAGNASPHIDVAAPAAKSARGREIFLLLRAEPADFIYPLLEAWSAKGGTGEILLAAREGDKVVYLNDLRHARGSALNLRLPVDTEGLPAGLALKGGSGIIRGRDYRGARVLAAFTPVPGTNWALVVKQDWAEVMAGTGAVGGLLLALVLGLLAAAGAGAYLLFSRQEREYLRAYAWMKSSYELLNEKANDGILVADLGSGRLLEANGRACAMYGYRPGEMNGLALSALIPGKDREAFVARLREDPPAGNRVYEAEHRRRDGSLFPAEISASVVESSGRELLFAIVRDISERKLAEAKLRELAQQRQLALDAAGMGWWRYDPSSRMATYDDGYKKIFEVEGYSRPNDEILKRLHPDDLPGVWAKVEAALDPVNPRSYAAEYRVVMPGGPVKWVEAHGLAVFEGEGKDRRAVELVGTVADTTARKKAEELLVRLTDQVPGVVYQYRLYPDGRSCFPYSSSGMEQIYEVTSEEVREDATPVFGRLHPDDLKSTSEAIFASARDLSIFHWEFRVVLPRQGLRWRLCDARPERLPDGGTLWYGIITDITERKLTEEALRESREKLELFVEHAPAAIAMFGADMKYLAASRRWLADYGLGDRDLAGLSHYEVFPEITERLKQIHRRCLAGAVERCEEDPFVRADGHTDWVRWEVRPWRKGDATIGGLLIFSEIITERKRAEEAVGRLNRDLVEKNNEMENFLYIATHDLRSPLVNIQGFSQNLQGYVRELGELAARAALPDGERARIKELSGGEIPEALDFVLESSRKMDALITALLKVSRTGRLELNPEQVEMNGLIQNILGAMKFQITEAGAEVKVGALPPCLADAGAVSQIFSNLLDNAVKYRDPARPLVVEITGKAEGQRSFYAVADNGPAIKEADLPRLWDLFYRPAGRNQGEGIGLPTGKKLAERSGGGIGAELRPGGGMVFRVELPRGGEGL